MVKKNYPLIFLSVLFSFSLRAQNPPPVKWQKCLGGSKEDVASNIQQTNDGGFIVAGYARSDDGDISGHHGSDDYTDFWIVKFDIAGNMEWEKSLGGSSWDEAYSIQQTIDGGFIVSGGAVSDDGDVTGHHGGDHYDYWIIKLDDAGNMEWQKCLGGTEDDFANSIQQTTDKGFIVVGFSRSNDGDVSGNHGGSDCWVVKLDSSGIMVWQKCFGGSGWYEGFLSVRQTVDGGFIVGGYTSSIDGDVSGNHGWYDCWLVKIDSSGIIMWQKCLGGSKDDFATSVQPTTDGGFIMCGISTSNDGDVSGWHEGYDYYFGNPTTDSWIAKLDSSGNIEWQKCLGGILDDDAQSVQQTIDGGFIVAGLSYSVDGDVSGNHDYGDSWIVKLDTSGNIEWQKCLGGSSYDDAHSIQQITGGGFLVAGASGSDDGDVMGGNGHEDFWITTLYSCSDLLIFYADADSDGYGNSSATELSLACFIPEGYVIDSTDCDDNNPNIYPGSNASSNEGIDFDCDGIVDGISTASLDPTETDFSVFPNPNDGVFMIDLALSTENNSEAKIELFSLFGQLILSEKAMVQKGRLHKEIKLSDRITIGTYLLKVIISENVYTVPINYQK